MLSGLLQAHGLAMNGGVLHAAECLSDSEMQDALDGYSYLGLESAAEIFARGKKLLQSNQDPEPYEMALDEDYQKLVFDDEFIFSTFKKHFLSNPTAYAPA